MSDDADDYLDGLWSEVPQPEQIEDARNAFELFYSYTLENGEGPGTKELLDNLLANPEHSLEDNARNLTGGLLALAAALSSLWRAQGVTPQQIVDFLRKLYGSS
ncbi:hypothetical protein [Mycobacteroides abscessus]